MMNTQHLPRKPVLYIIFGGTLATLGIAGQLLSFSTLLPSLLVASVCLVLGFLGRRRYTMLLIDVWIFAYVYLYLSEHVLDFNNVLWLFGEEITHITEGFIVSAFGATLVGYGLVLLRQQTSKYASSKFTTMRESIPPEIGFFTIVLLFVVIYYVLRVISLDQLLYMARSQRSPEVDVSFFGHLMDAVTVILPAVAVFLLNRYKMSLFLTFSLLVVSAVAIFAVFLSGTRYFMGFQLGSVLFLIACLPKRLFKRKHLFLLVVGAFLLIMPVIQRNVRTSGLGNVSISEVLTSELAPESFLSSEGILRINAYIHLSRAYPFEDRIPENLFILYWWIPRAFWSDKPVMAGYWTIRELTNESGFSAGHSVSGGFAMPALLDFGPIVGAFFCVVYGILIGCFEVYAWRQHDLQRPGAILAGALYFGVFFMMRSLHTSLIFLMVVSIVSILPLTLLERFSMASQIRRLYLPDIDTERQSHDLRRA